MSLTKIHIKYLVTLAILLLSIRSASASHIVGGDMTYRFIQFDANRENVTFEFTLNLYRDNSPVSSLFPTDVDFEVYQKNVLGDWSNFEIYNAGHQAVINVPYIENPCREEPAFFVGVETTSYITEITLPISDSDYMIVVDHCCRNFSISNVIFNDPITDEVGAVYDVLLTPEAQRLGNNSATFNKYPPIFICTALPLREDVSAVDLEGDSLVYSLCSPLNSKKGSCLRDCKPPYEALTFIPPYSAVAPMAGNPTVGIDAKTGIMYGTPEVSGRYVVGLCIEEYRNGQLLSTVRRDFQYNTIACGEELEALLEADRIRFDRAFTPPRKIFEIDVCGPQSKVVKDQSTGGSVLYTYDWVLRNPQDELIVEEFGISVPQIFASLPEHGIYNGSMILNDGLSCPDTAFFELRSFPGLEAAFSYELDSCFLSAVAFTDASYTESDKIISWDWDFNAEGRDSAKNILYKFDDRGIKEVKLVITDNNNCTDSLTQDVNYMPLFDSDIPVEMEEQVICYGDSIVFGGEIYKDEGRYRYKLTDAVSGCDTLEKQLILEVHEAAKEIYETKQLCSGDTLDYFGKTLTQAGTYSHAVASKVVNCDSIQYYLDLTLFPRLALSIDVKPLFVCSPGQYALTAQHNLEQDSVVSILWDLGDGSPLRTENTFEYEYAQRGTYTVSLTIEDVRGCASTLVEAINYNPPFEPATRITETEHICFGDSIKINDQWIYEAGSYDNQIKHAGTTCDSIIRTSVIVVQDQAKERTIDTTLCPDETLNYLGKDYTAGTTEQLIELSVLTGCDSIIHQLNITALSAPEIQFESAVVTIPEWADTEMPVLISEDLASVQWYPSEGLNCPTCPRPIINYNRDTTYTVEVLSEEGCSNSGSVEINFIEIQPYIPNVINPNATDERDRYFLVQKPELALKTAYYDLAVYDRWGALLFDGKDLIINDMASSLSANDLTSGVYVYVIVIQQPQESLRFVGNFTVLP